MGRHKLGSEHISQWKINEEKEALKILYALRLINIHIINNKYAVINGLSNQFMSKLPTMNTVHRTLLAEIKESFELLTITGFRDKKSANEYVKQNNPELTIIPDKNLILDEATYFKTLVQVDPDTNQVLAVYQSMNGFINKNGYSTAQFTRNVNTEELISGYKWFQAMEWDYPITRPDNKYYDPLGKGETFIMRETGDTRAKRSDGKVILTAPDGTKTEYINRVAAAKALNVSNTRVSDYAKKNKMLNGYKIEIIK